jgi:hypothetical protein
MNYVKAGSLQKALNVKSQVKNALEAISFADVEQWFSEVFGQSMLSKRKTLFSAHFDDTETA